MKNPNVYKPPVVLDIVPAYPKQFSEYRGFFTELVTCNTIEEGLKSFDDLAAKNAERRKPRNFEYK